MVLNTVQPFHQRKKKSNYWESPLSPFSVYPFYNPIPETYVKGREKDITAQSQVHVIFDIVLDMHTGAPSGTRVLCCCVFTQALLLLRFYSATCAAQHLAYVSYAATFLLNNLCCYVVTQPLVLLKANPRHILLFVFPSS